MAGCRGEDPEQDPRQPPTFRARPLARPLARLSRFLRTSRPSPRLGTTAGACCEAACPHRPIRQRPSLAGPLVCASVKHEPTSLLQNHDTRVRHMATTTPTEAHDVLGLCHVRPRRVADAGAPPPKRASSSSAPAPCSKNALYSVLAPRVASEPLGRILDGPFCSILRPETRAEPEHEQYRHVSGTSRPTPK